MSVGPVALGDQSFIAATPDGDVLVRVAVKGHVLGVQLEPQVMRRPGHEIAARIMACADVAYLQGQLALRQQMQQANVDPVCYQDMPGEAELAAARERLRKL